MKQHSYIRKALSLLLAALVVLTLFALPTMATTPEEEAADTAASVVGFWFSYSLIGFILPLILGGVGAALACSPRRERPRYWWILTIVCGVWLVLAMALALLLITA